MRLEELLPALHRHPGGSVRIDSDIPPGLGFGSSAALCAALASAFAAVFPAEERGLSVWELAHEAERLFHGTPSGIDTGLALLDGLVLFHPAPPGLPRARRLPGLELELVVGAVPRRAESAVLIRGLGERMRAGDERTADALAQLGGLALQAAALLEQHGDPRRRIGELGRLAGLAQDGLAGLGLSTPELEDMLACGRAAGALGGKLSGAGGGGAFYLIFPDRAAAAAAAVHLRELARQRGLPSAGTIEALSYRGGDHGQGEG